MLDPARWDCMACLSHGQSDSVRSDSLGRGRHVRGSVLSAQLKRSEPEEADAKFRQAVADENKGHLAEAERLYEEVLALQPSYVDALHRLAGLALQTRRTERGAELIAQAIQISPAIAQTHAN